jgi:hypothetical protein
MFRRAAHHHQGHTIWQRRKENNVPDEDGLPVETCWTSLILNPEILVYFVPTVLQLVLTSRIELPTRYEKHKKRINQLVNLDREVIAVDGYNPKKQKQ